MLRSPLPLLFLLVPVAIAKLWDNDTLLPVMHIKEVQNGYIAFPDPQLGIDDKSPTTPCTPRAEAEAEQRRVEGILTAEEESRPFNDTSPLNGTDVGETFELKIIKPLCDY